MHGMPDSWSPPEPTSHESRWEESAFDYDSYGLTPPLAASEGTSPDTEAVEAGTSPPSDGRPSFSPPPPPPPPPPQQQPGQIPSRVSSFGSIFDDYEIPEMASSVRPIQSSEHRPPEPVLNEPGSTAPILMTPPPDICFLEPQAYQPPPTELGHTSFSAGPVVGPPPPEELMQAPPSAGMEYSETTEYHHYIGQPTLRYEDVVDYVSHHGASQASPLTPTKPTTPLYGTIGWSEPRPRPSTTQVSSLVDPELITTTSYEYEGPVPELPSELPPLPRPPKHVYPVPVNDPCRFDSPGPSTSTPSLPTLPYPAVESTSPKPHRDQETIQANPEEKMLAHQMVVGTGGLIEQIVHPDKHPEWIDCNTVTLKFKIVDPEYLEKEAGVKTLGFHGGNYQDMPNTPSDVFRAYAPVVPDPEELRPDIRSPMELGIMNLIAVNGEGMGPTRPEASRLPADKKRGGVTGDHKEGDEEDVQDFHKLNQEAQGQPRGWISDLLMKRNASAQQKRGGVRIMVVKREEPKSEQNSRWRRFVDALRRVLTFGR